MGADFQDNINASSGSELESDQDLQAREEELRSLFTQARTLIQSNHVPEALSIIAEAEESGQEYWERLPADVRYLPDFLRARAYLQQVEPALAQPHLEAALDIVADDPEAAARVRNLLGVVYLEQQQPDLALKQHLECLQVALAKGFKDQDRSFRLSVYRNLANDYLATNNILQAIDVYKRGLAILEGHPDLERQAGMHWGLALAYKVRNDWARALAHGFRSVKLYEEVGSKADAASVGLNLAEMLIDVARYRDAERLLKRVKVLLDFIDSLDMMSYYYIYQADLSRRQGNLDTAKSYAAKALELAKVHSQRVDTEGTSSFGDTAETTLDGSAKSRNSTSGRLWTPPTYVYAEALGVAAMVEEDIGHKDAADQLFQEAIELITQANFRDILPTISQKYAKVLEIRGEHDKAMEYYRMAVLPRLVSDTLVEFQ
jgi:tetratricopeptide (TPR) repeat protein